MILHALEAGLDLFHEADPLAFTLERLMTLRGRWAAARQVGHGQG